MPSPFGRGHEVDLPCAGTLWERAHTERPIEPKSRAGSIRVGLGKAGLVSRAVLTNGGWYAATTTGYARDWGRPAPDSTR